MNVPDAIARWWESIGRSTDNNRLQRNRAYLVGMVPNANGDGRWLELAGHSVALIEKRLAELGAVEAFTPSRKTTQKRARGYIERYRPQRKILDLLSDVEAVLGEYQKHWPLTCRQLFYRLVGSRGYEKSESFYKKLCHHVANARRARLIPFRAIRDDGVATVDLVRFDDEEDFRAHVAGLARNYRRNLLTKQPRHIEVWCEAAGMIFQLADVVHEFSVQVYSSSGFDSLTAKKVLSDRICRIGKPAVVLHLGDHDPSGESIFDTVAQDVAAFVEVDRPWPQVTVEFRRVALTAAQVTEHSLPTSPPKASDTRSRSWTGETCQLEALAPDVIADILSHEIRKVIDGDQLDDDLEIEALERRRVALALPAPAEGAGDA